MILKTSPAGAPLQQGEQAKAGFDEDVMKSRDLKKEATDAMALLRTVRRKREDAKTQEHEQKQSS